MQKAASIERKVILKEQRNLIKHQLSTDAMLSKMKVNMPRERRLSGPLKVIQSHSESIRSETSISKRSSSDRDVYSITSHTHSIVSKVSEISGEELASRNGHSDIDSTDLANKLASEACGVPISQMKKTLLMREAALQKRRRAAEELLQWHKKLLEEEKRITELESTANAIISHIPYNISRSSDVAEKYRFKGKQLNQLWFNLTGCEEKKFAEDKVYPMSQLALERFCKSAREYSSKTKKILRKVSDSEINSEYSEARTDDSVSENIPQSAGKKTVPIVDLNDYASDFDVESIQDIISDKDMDVVDQNLNQLISNFSKIEADISSLGIKQYLRNNEDQESEESLRSERSASDVEVSVIETAKTSGSERALLNLCSKDKNLSIVEEINRSTKNTLSKSEEVLLKLSQIEDRSEKSSLREETRAPSEKTASNIEEIPPKLSLTEKSISSHSSPTQKSSIIEDYQVTSEGKTSLSKVEEILGKLSQSETAASSNKKSSFIEEATNETKDNLSKTEEILDRLSLAESKISTDVSSNKKSAFNEDNRAASEAKDNLNKTEDILKRLTQVEDKISTEVSSDKRSSLIEEAVNETKDNLSKTEEILSRLSLEESKVSTDASSKEESSLIEEHQAAEDNLSKTEEILEGLGEVEDKIESEVSSNRKSSVLEEATNDAKDNLSKTEGGLDRLSLADSNISTDVSSNRKSSANQAEDHLRGTEAIVEGQRQVEDEIVAEVSSDKKSSVIEETTNVNISKTEETLEGLSQVEDKITAEVSSNKKSSLIEEATNETKDDLSKTEKTLEVLSQVEDKINTDASASSAERSSSANEALNNLSKTEQILQRLDQIEDTVEDNLISTEEHTNSSPSEDICSDKNSSLSEEKQETAMGEDNLSKTKEVLLSSQAEQDEDHSGESANNSGQPEELMPELTQEEDGSSSEISSKLSEEPVHENDDLGSPDLVQQNIEALPGLAAVTASEGSRTIKAADDLSCEKNLAPDLLHLKKGLESDGLEGSPKKISLRSSEEASESLKETYIDEELSVDEEIRSEKTSRSRQSEEENIEIRDDDEPQMQEIIEIKDGEEKVTEESLALKDTDEAIKAVDEDAEEKLSHEEDITNKDVSNEESEDNSVTSTTASAVTTRLDLSYGIIDHKTSQQTPSDAYTDNQESDKSHATASARTDRTPSNKEELNSYEEKELDSLSSSASTSPQLSAAADTVDKEEKSAASEESKSSTVEEKSSKSEAVDVKKRVSEIMADASSPSRGDKSPRVQDLYVTTYDLVSPAHSPELESPMEEQKTVAAKNIFGTEAEEILRMQLAIEQEIKLITEQQQKEHVPYMYVREIPNKPPPPYTPPSSLPPANIITIVPTTQEIEEITKYSAKILHKAHLSNSLDNISISENTLGLVCKNITKECYKFVFDLCKEISKDHYKQFEKEKCVSWLQVKKKPQLAVVRPLDMSGLEKHLNKNLKELFGYEKPNRRENAIIKWSRKKRDYVDEILVMESQAEETQWTNYDKDELLVMNAVTNEIMNMLLKETGDVFSKIISKRTFLY